MSLFKLSSLLVVALISNVALAGTSVNLRGFFPAVCNGEAGKAVLANSARVEDVDGDFKVTFKLALLECEAGGARFVNYAPVPSEFIQVYAVRPTAIGSLRLSIPPYQNGQSYSDVTFAIPKRLVPGRAEFRVDIFLYQDMIPLKLTLTSDGQALIRVVGPKSKL